MEGSLSAACRPKSIAFFDKLKAAALCGGLFLRFSSLFPNNFP